VRELFSHQK
jgi:integration host factor subunit alpha